MWKRLSAAALFVLFAGLTLSSGADPKPNTIRGHQTKSNEVRAAANSKSTSPAPRALPFSTHWSILGSWNRRMPVANDPVALASAANYLAAAERAAGEEGFSHRGGLMKEAVEMASNANNRPS